MDEQPQCQHVPDQLAAAGIVRPLQACRCQPIHSRARHLHLATSEQPLQPACPAMTCAPTTPPMQRAGNFRQHEACTTIYTPTCHNQQHMLACTQARHTHHATDPANACRQFCCMHKPTCHPCPRTTKCKCLPLRLQVPNKEHIATWLMLHWCTCHVMDPFKHAGRSRSQVGSGCAFGPKAALA
jgi:hypothetical protein